MDSARAIQPRFKRRPAARPEELIEAALEVFGEQGFQQTTLEEVARRAGVSKGTVYLYFTSKDDLFRAMVEKKVVVLLEDAELMARTHGGSATELLVKAVDRLWDALSRTDIIRMARLVQAELPHFPTVRQYFFEHVIERHRRMLHDIAVRGIASGEFRPDATIVLPRLVPAMLMQLHQTHYLFGDLERRTPTRKALRDAVIAVLVRGIGTKPDRPQRGGEGKRSPRRHRTGRRVRRD